MKKIISIMLVLVICLSMCACSSEIKSNEIKLTLENYEDYLSITKWTGGEDKWQTRNVIKLNGGEYTNAFYATIYGWAKAEATTTNFNFNNVKIVLRITGSTVAMQKLPPYGLTGDEVTVKFDFEVVVDTNIAGNGEGKTRYTLPNNLVTDQRAMTHTSNSWCNIEIVEIYGTVTPI